MGNGESRKAKCVVTPRCGGPTPQPPWKRGDRPADVNGVLVALDWLDPGMIIRSRPLFPKCEEYVYSIVHFIIYIHL